MPRKANYGLDYDDDYDTYDDYDYEYDYDDDAEEGKPSQINPAVSKPGLWRCSICTYDNEESLSSCDICGVVRESTANLNNNGDTKFDGTCKDTGASVMAKSLFAPMPFGIPKTALLFQQPNDELLSNEGHNRNVQARFAPFKFDSLSPDDLVYAGKNSSRVNQRVNSFLSAPIRASSSISKSKDVDKVFSNADMLGSSSATSSKSSHHDANQSSSAGKNVDKEENLASSLQNLNLDKNAVKRKNIISRKGYLHTEYKPEKWMLLDHEQGSLTQLNLAIVGHVDSGKSTLSGRLLHLLGRVSQKEMHKYEKEAKEMGKGSFAYAWALDESAEERERGITMTVGVAYFDSKKYNVVLLDSPGHKDFVPNMISGATQADAAILVIDSSIGSFEAGMDGGGQTREHAQLIRSFGVEHLIVAVNKMDVVDYSKERFDFIKMQLGSFLRACGFKESSVTWIPLSAMENQNLVKAASDARLSCWFAGPCLLDAMDSLQPPVRDVSKPLCLPICDVIKSHSLGHVAASGKLEAGAIRNGSKVLVMPSGDIATVRSIEIGSHICNIARAGDNVAVVLQGIDASNVMSGGVLCHPDHPVAIATRLELKVLILDIATPILIGSQVEFYIYHVKEAARVAKILLLIDPKTGKVSKRSPRFLTAKQSAVIEVVLDGSVCVEEFSKSRALGRAFLRSSGSTIAVGIVTRVIEQE